MKRTEEFYNKQPKKWIVNLVFLFAVAVAMIYSFQGSSIN
jgi:hypothetical protein